MNLEPNKNHLKARKKTPTTTFFPSQITLPSTSSTTFLNSKDKPFENIKKTNNYNNHNNKFEVLCPNSNRSQLKSKSKSKSSSKLASREQSQVNIKKAEKFEINANPFQIGKDKQKTNNIKKTYIPDQNSQLKTKAPDTSNMPKNYGKIKQNYNINEFSGLNSQKQKYFSKNANQNFTICNSITIKNNKKFDQLNPSTKPLKNIVSIESCNEYYNYSKNIEEIRNNHIGNIKSLDFKPKQVDFFDSVVISEEEPILECEEMISIEEKPELEMKPQFHEDKKGCPFDSNTLNFLIIQENLYNPDAFYLQKNQNNINSLMRTILMDWMMEVCAEFTLKRETFHLASNYVDRYLSKVKNIERNKLQLIGLSSMYIASKVEEIFAPKVIDFMKSADNAFHVEEIKNMEIQILLNLQFYLNPPTLNMWSNWYMNQWDLFIENPQNIRSLKFPLRLFKLPNEESYLLFREYMQILDNIILDIQTLQYKPRALIASLMYLILGKNMKEFTLKQIIDQFPFTSNYLISNKIKFNYVFSEFLTFCFGFEIFELLPTIQYVATFFGLNIVNNLPTAAKLNKENVLDVI